MTRPPDTGGRTESEMGLFNILSPVFTLLDDIAGTALPAPIRIALWAGLLAIGTMLLYKFLSPQKRIGQAKRQAREARRRLNRFDGEFADAGPLIRDQFVTAFRHIGLVIPGTFIAILPLLCFLVWADNHYGHDLPPAGQSPGLATVPADVRGVEIGWRSQSRPPMVHVSSATNDSNISYPMTAPVTVIAQYSAWNWLVGNPLGYLPDDSPIDAVLIDLPEHEYFHFGPQWMRGWLAVFIPVMFIVSLLMFKWAKIE